LQLLERVQNYLACFGLYPVSETLWYFLSSTYKTMDKVQNKPNSSVQHTPSSESFQVYLCNRYGPGIYPSFRKLEYLKIRLAKTLNHITFKKILPHPPVDGDRSSLRNVVVFFVFHIQDDG
jgi:hypothetical protein